MDVLLRIQIKNLAPLRRRCSLRLAGLIVDQVRFNDEQDPCENECSDN